MLKKLSRKQMIAAVSATSAVVVGVGVGVPVGLLVNNGKAASPTPLIKDLTKTHAPIAVPYGTLLEALVPLAPGDIDQPALYEAPVLDAALTTYTPTTLVDEDDDAKIAYLYVPKDSATRSAITYVYRANVTALQAGVADISIDSKSYAQGFEYVPSLTASEHEAIDKMLPDGHMIDNISDTVIYDAEGKQTTIAVIKNKPVGYLFSVVHKTAIAANYVGQPGKVTVNYSVQPSATSGTAQQVGTREIAYGVGLDRDPEAPKPIAGYVVKSVTYKLTKSADAATPVGNTTRAAVKDFNAGSEFQVVYEYEAFGQTGYSYSQYYLYTVTKAAIADSEVPTITGTSNLTYKSAYTPPTLVKQNKYEDWSGFTYRITTPVTTGTTVDPRFNTVKEIALADFDDLPAGTVVTATATAKPDANHAGKDGTAVYTVTVVAQDLKGATENREGLWDIGGSLGLLAAPNTVTNYRAFGEPVYTGSDGISFTSLTDEKIEAKFMANPNYTVTQTYVAQPNGPNYGGQPYIFNTTYHLFKITPPATATYQYGADFAPAAPTILSNFFNPWTRKSPGKVKITKASTTGSFTRVGEYNDADVKNFGPDTEFVVEYTTTAKGSYLASGPITTSLTYKVSARPVSHADITTSLEYTYGSDFAAPSPGARLDGYGEWTGGTSVSIPAQNGQPVRTATFGELKNLPVGSTFSVVFTAAPAAGNVGNPVKSTFVYTVVAKPVTPYKTAITATISYGDDFSKLPAPPSAPQGYGSFSLERANSVYIYKLTDSIDESEREFSKVGYYPTSDIPRFPTSKTANTEFRVTYVADPAANYTGEKAVYEISVTIVPKAVTVADMPDNQINAPESQWAKTTYGQMIPSDQLPRPATAPTGFGLWTGPFYKVIKAIPTTATNYLAKFAMDSEFTANDVTAVPAGTSYVVYYKSSVSKNYAVAPGSFETITFGKNFTVTRAPLTSTVEWPDNMRVRTFNPEFGDKNWDVIPAYIAKNITVPAGFGPLSSVPKLKVTVQGQGAPGVYVVGKEFTKSEASNLPFLTTFSETYEAQSLDENYETATISYSFLRAVNYADSDHWVYYPIAETIPRNLLATPPKIGNITWSGPVYAMQPNRYNSGENTPPVTLTSDQFFSTFFKDGDYPTTKYTATTPNGETLTYTTTYAQATDFVVSYSTTRQFGFDSSKLDPDANTLFAANATARKIAAFNEKFSGSWTFSGDKVISAPDSTANNFEQFVYDLLQSGASGLSNWSKGLASVPAGTVYELYYTSARKRTTAIGEAKLTLRVTVVPFDGKNSGLSTVIVTAGLKQGMPFTPPAAPDSLPQFGTFGGGSWEVVGLIQNNQPASFDASGVARLPLGASFDYVYRFKFPNNDNVVTGSLPKVDYVYRYTISADGQINYTDIPTNATYLRGSTFTAPSAQGFGPFAGYGVLKSRISLLGPTGSTPLDAKDITALIKGQVFSYVWYYESNSGGKEITKTTNYTVVNPSVTKTFVDEEFVSSQGVVYGQKAEYTDTSKLPDLSPYGYAKWRIAKRVITKTIPTTDLRYASWLTVGRELTVIDLYKLPAGVQFTTYHEAPADSNHEGQPVRYGIVYTVTPAEAPVKPIINVSYQNAYVPGGPLPKLDDGILLNPATSANGNVDFLGKRIYSDFAWSNDVLITNLPAGYAGVYKIGQRIFWSEIANLPVGAYFNYTKSATLVNENYQNGFWITNYYMRVGAFYTDIPANWNTPEEFDPTDLGKANPVTKSIKEALSAITATSLDEPSFTAQFVNGYTLLGDALAKRLGIKVTLPKGSSVQVYKKPGEKVVTYDIYYGSSYAQAKVEFTTFGQTRDNKWVLAVINDLVSLKTSYLEDKQAFLDATAGTNGPEDAIDAAPRLGLPLDRGFYRGIATIKKAAGSAVFSVEYQTYGNPPSTKTGTIDLIARIPTPLGLDLPSVHPWHVVAPDVQREIEEAVSYLKAGTTTWKSSLGNMKYDTKPFGDLPILQKMDTKLDRIENLTETTGLSVGDTSLLNRFPNLQIGFTMLDQDSKNQSIYVPDPTSKGRLLEVAAKKNQIFYIIKPKGQDYFYTLPIKITNFNADPYASQAATLAAITSTTLSEQAFTNLEVVRSALWVSGLKLGIVAPASVDSSVFRLIKLAGSKEIAFEYYLPNSVDVIKRVTATITNFSVEQQ